MRQLITAIDLSILVPLLVCIGASILVMLLPVLRSAVWLAVISVLAMAGTYRRAVFGYLLINLLVYVFVCGLAWLSSNFNLRQQNRWRWSCAAMLALLVVFLAGRYYLLESYGVSFAGLQLFLYSLNMWAFLRLITLLWEFGSGKIELPSLMSYVLWVGLPFTLIGPILRYSEFERQQPFNRVRENSSGVLSVSWFGKLLLASVQLVLGLGLSAFQVWLSGAGAGIPRWERAAISFSLAPWSFYLLWAGYFNFMEALAPFWGINLPPSFNRPFGRRNLSEFWACWNMTATSIFRDYFFYNRWGLTKVNLYLNTLIVFLMVGVWHGLNGYWILWGLMHGIGFCAFLWYRSKKERFAAWQQKFPAAPLRLASIGATYVYVCSCWFLPPTILKLIRW